MATGDNKFKIAIARLAENGNILLNTETATVVFKLFIELRLKLMKRPAMAAALHDGYYPTPKRTLASTNQGNFLLIICWLPQPPEATTI